jgi:hypothetical protein
MNFILTYNLLESLTEDDRRIVSHPDILYHYTRPLAVMNIFKEDSMRVDLNCEAVCFTTDAGYQIYDQPCGLIFSRKKITDAGYELKEYDDFEELEYNPEGTSESEERVYENINGVSNLVTGVIIKWDCIGILDSPEGHRIEDIYYDDNGNDHDTYELRLEDFTKFLETLKARGIKVQEIGKPAAPTGMVMNGKVQINYKVDNPIVLNKGDAEKFKKRWNHMI